MKKNIKKEVLDYIIIIIVVILIRTLIFTPIKVEQSSMNPTLNSKDIMILNKIGYKINGLKRFDIVVIKKDNDYLIKRVIGLPNETLEYKDDKLYIDGKEVEEPFTKKITPDFKLDNKISKDSYFLMGDNRSNSVDSRIFGEISKENILGKTNFIIFPFDRIGIKN